MSASPVPPFGISTFRVGAQLHWRAWFSTPDGNQVVVSTGRNLKDRLEVEHIETAGNFRRRGYATRLVRWLEARYDRRAVPRDIRGDGALPFWREILGADFVTVVENEGGYAGKQDWMKVHEALDRLKLRSPAEYRRAIARPPH